MKRLGQLLAATAIVVSPFGMSDRALANECQISNTGSNSTNICTDTSKYTCEVENNNTIIVRNESGQQVASGNATSNDNTNGGGATSGSATNENGTNFDVAIDNSGACGVTAVTPVNPTPEQPAPAPEQPTPGKGAAILPETVTQRVAAPTGPAPTVLPYTSGNPAAALLAGIAGILGAGAAASRLAISAYGRYKS